MFKRCYQILILIALSSCGGGGGDDNNFTNSISGKWTGQLYQNGGVYCSDGQFLGVGSGTATSVAFIEISGGDSPGSEVILKSLLCEYRGVREREETLRLIPTSSNCSDAVIISEIEQDKLEYTTDPATPIADLNGQPTCTISEVGQLVRE